MIPIRVSQENIGAASLVFLISIYAMACFNYDNPKKRNT